MGTRIIALIATGIRQRHHRASGPLRALPRCADLATQLHPHPHRLFDIPSARRTAEAELEDFSIGARCCAPDTRAPLVVAALLASSCHSLELPTAAAPDSYVRELTPQDHTAVVRTQWYGRVVRNSHSTWRCLVRVWSSWDLLERYREEWIVTRDLVATNTSALACHVRPTTDYRMAGQ